MRKILEVPRPLRVLVRTWEPGLVFLGAGIGALAGLVVAGMSFAVSELHAVLFGLQAGQRLSAIDKLDPHIAIAVPMPSEVGSSRLATRYPTSAASPTGARLVGE